jgi:hypothetical protein
VTRYACDFGIVERHHANLVVRSEDAEGRRRATDIVRVRGWSDGEENEQHDCGQHLRQSFHASTTRSETELPLLDATRWKLMVRMSGHHPLQPSIGDQPHQRNEYEESDADLRRNCPRSHDSTGAQGRQEPVDKGQRSRNVCDNRRRWRR